MIFGLFGGSTPQYQGLGTTQPRQNPGLLGSIFGLFGASGPVAYKQPPAQPAPTLSTAAEDQEVEAMKKAITVIVVLDPDALADAVLQKLQEPVSVTQS
jgi:hypothetical protein